MFPDYDMIDYDRIRIDDIKTFIHQQLQKAREEERERIKKWVKQRISHEIGNVIASTEGAYQPTEIEIAEEEAHNRAIECVLKFLDHSELDQDKQ